MRFLTIAAFTLALAGCGSSNHSTAAAPTIPDGSHVASAVRDKHATVDTVRAGSTYTVTWTPEGGAPVTATGMALTENTLSDDAKHLFFLSYADDGRIYLYVDHDAYLFGWGG